MTSPKGVDVRALKVGLDSVVGFVGFSLMIAALLGIFLNASCMAPYAVDGFVFRLLGAVAGMTFYGIIFLASQRLSGSRSVVLLILAGCGLFSFAYFALLPTSPFAFVAVFFAICGICALACLWFAYLCTQQGRVALFFVAVGLAVGSAVCFAISLLDGVQLRGFLSVFYAFSTGCAVVLFLLRPDLISPIEVSNKESDKRSKIQWSSTLMLSTSFFELGFVIEAASGIAQSICLTVSALIAVMLAIDSTTRHVVSERSVRPLATPLTVLAFLSIFLFDGAVRVLALSLLCALVVFYVLSGWAAMVEHVRACALSSLRTYAKARLLDYVGLALGFACGHAAVTLFGNGDTIASVQICLAAAFALSLMASFCNKPRFPERGAVDLDPVSPSFDKDLWYRRCCAVSEEYGLSERQREVLVLIAQGRNAKYVEQALTISLSTAQTHIRNIYRKMDIHSRQELLDLIESTKLYGEE